MSTADQTRLALRALLEDFPGFELPSDGELGELLYACNPVVELNDVFDIRLTWSDAQKAGHAPRYYGAAALLIEILTHALNEARQPC